MDIYSRSFPRGTLAADMVFVRRRGTIALSLNGCPTRGEGPLALEADGFPAIPAGRSLAIQYDAKVAPEEKPDAVTAATVVFTIAAAE